MYNRGILRGKGDVFIFLCENKTQEEGNRTIMTASTARAELSLVPLMDGPQPIRARTRPSGRAGRFCPH